MFNRNYILIVEDEPIVAMSLADSVEGLDGRVAGPASTVAEALTLIDQVDISAAILDANLADRDVTPVPLMLIQRRVPFVIHSGTGIPAELAIAHPRLCYVPKPAPPYIVMSHLLSTKAGD